MNFELTISGLCVTVLRAAQNDVEHPVAIDIVIPKACEHSSRLSYLPDKVKHKPVPGLKPRLLVDETGGRVASLDIEDLVLELSFRTNPHNEFYASWGSPQADRPSGPWEETWLNWLPRLEELGFEPFAMGDPGTLPSGACARLSLPFGRLAARNVLKKENTNDFHLWEFPAEGIIKALANDLVYTADGVETLSIKDSRGIELLDSTIRGTRPVRMCITNDMTYVPENYNSTDLALKHLKHIDAIAEGTFQTPQEVSGQATGRPICMSVVFVEHERHHEVQS